MAGQKFQYDESGGTFFYFILSFLALILIPATFYFWPKKKTEGKVVELFLLKKTNSKTLCLTEFVINLLVPWLMTIQF